MLSDLLNGQGQTNNDAGMLGLALLQASQNGGNLSSLLPLLAQINARKNQEPPQAPSPTMPSTTQPSNGADALPQDKSALLATLKQQAAAAYPDNPTLQQVAITQAIQESGLLSRPSKLATENNNLFGIKAPGTAGLTNMVTTEYANGSPMLTNANFGRNNSVSDSFMQHRNLLTNNKRYAPVVSAQSPQDAFTALQRSGYATDPRYAKHLDRVYRQYVAPLYES